MVALKGSAYVRSVTGYTGYSVDMVGTATASDTMIALTASDTQLDFSTVASGGTVGMVWIKNNGTTDVITDYIQLSYGTGGAFAAAVFTSLRSGESIAFRPNADTIYCKAFGAGSIQVSHCCAEL